MKKLITIALILLMAGSAWANGDGYDWSKAAKETTEALRLENELVREEPKEPECKDEARREAMAEGLKWLKKEVEKIVRESCE